MNTTPETPLEISVTDVQALREGKTPFFFLDCREPSESELVHIKGTTLIPMGEVMQRPSEIDPKRPVVVHCAVGARSAKVVDLLRQAGYPHVYKTNDGKFIASKSQIENPVGKGLAPVETK